MFGVDPDQLTSRPKQPRKKRWPVRPLVLLLQLILAALIVLVGAVVDFVTHMDRVQVLLDRALDKPEIEVWINIDDAMLAPIGDWKDPTSWTVLVHGLHVEAKVIKAPDLFFDFARADHIHVVPRDDGAAMHIEEAWVDGLWVLTHQQKYPEPWTPKYSALKSISAGIGHVRRFRFTAPEDDPAPPIRIDGVFGTVWNLEYRFEPRELDLVASATGESLSIGDVSAHHLRTADFRIESSSIFFKGHGWFLDRRVDVLHGEVLTFHIRPRTSVDVRVVDFDLGAAISSITDQPSPIQARLDATLNIRSGGELERGDFRIFGDAVVREGRLQLDPRTKYVILDAIRLIPWVNLNAQNQVVLDTLKGQVYFSPEEVQLRSLTYRVSRRLLEVNGTLSGDDLYFLIRLHPPERLADRRVGLGFILTGTTERQEVRLADRFDMLRDDPWRPLPTAAREKLEDLEEAEVRRREQAQRQRKEELRKRRRGGDAVPL